MKTHTYPLTNRILAGLILVVIWTVACKTTTVPTAIASPIVEIPQTSLAPPTDTLAPPPSATVSIPTSTVTLALPLIASQSPTPNPSIRFAVIGDYGGGGEGERQVADLVSSWEPDLVITVGDNNYPNGTASTIDTNIGQFFHMYIAPYTGGYGEGAEQNRFFPTLGNHDWYTTAAQPYLDYFTLPGNERYYDFTWGPVHFFAVDSDSNEPDGVSRLSTQANWLHERLAASTSPWNIVYFHHAPYSSGTHGPTDWMQWPFKEWGASAVLAGHDHTYERLQIDGLPYFVNGLGGHSRYNFQYDMPGSQVRYNSDFGAMLVDASSDRLTFQFITQAGEIIDSLELLR